MRRVDHYHQQEFMDSMCGYIESYEFYNEGIIEKLEAKICEYTGSKYAICVNSATNAIFMCLYYQFKNKSEIRGRVRNEVILPAYGFPAAYKAAKFLDLIPVPVDIDKETLSITPEAVKKKFSPWTLAYVNVETNGIVGHAEALQGIDPEVLYIEDAAPSMLQLYNGKRAGTFGDVGIYSFSPTKPFCCGEGGAIVTDDAELYGALKNIRSGSYLNFTTSLNFNMSPFLAAYLIPQFDKARLIGDMRELIHQNYSESIEIFKQEGVTNKYGSIMYLSDYAVKIAERLGQLKIEYRYKHYPVLQDKSVCPVAHEVSERIIELPFSHKMLYTHVLAICDIIKRIENG